MRVYHMGFLVKQIGRNNRLRCRVQTILGWKTPLEGGTLAALYSIRIWRILGQRNTSDHAGAKKLVTTEPLSIYILPHTHTSIHDKIPIKASKRMK